jgi:hypothetical protein
MKQKKVTSADLWQLKIMNALMNTHQDRLKINHSKSSLISTEIISSLLIRVNNLMKVKLEERKTLLRKLISAKDLNFLHEISSSVVEELVMLADFYDLPLNLIDSSAVNVQHMNLMQFLMDFKKLNRDSEFVINLWKMLK